MSPLPEDRTKRSRKTDLSLVVCLDESTGTALYLENCIQREIIKPFIILTRHLKISKRKI